jgi:uncharacterized protein (TIGR02757 family)
VDGGVSSIRLKKVLDRFYSRYDFSGRIIHDPIEFPRRYTKHEDIELVAFIASCFAYGRVELFKPVVERILNVMGKQPYDFIKSFDIVRHEGLFRDLKYRFNTTQDISALLLALHIVIQKYNRLEALFKVNYKENDEHIGNGLKGFVKAFLHIDTSAVYRKAAKPLGYVQFFPLPGFGSACKRMNLFLRWMIRDRDIDFGIWKGIPKNKLIIPLDTHIARISQCLSLTRRKSPDWKMAVEITESLKQFDPDDPIKYDFALCHLGISGMCRKGKCSSCFIGKWN